MAIVSPDAGGVTRARSVADRLGEIMTDRTLAHLQLSRLTPRYAVAQVFLLWSLLSNVAQLPIKLIPCKLLETSM